MSLMVHLKLHLDVQQHPLHTGSMYGKCKLVFEIQIEVDHLPKKYMFFARLLMKGKCQMSLRWNFLILDIQGYHTS